MVRKVFGRFQPSFGGNFLEASSQIYIHMSKPAVLLFFFQEETDNNFCIQQDTAWVEGMGLSHQFLFPQNLFFSISNLQADMLLTVLRAMFAPIWA